MKLPLLSLCLLFLTPVLGFADKLDVLDLSFLWPVPKTGQDVANLLTLQDDAADGDLMSDKVFNALMAKAVTVPLGGRNIGFAPGVAADKALWRVAGIRINPVSIGTHQALIDGAGEVPSLRLIVQPVTVAGDKAKLHDTAFHVVFDYVKGMDGSKFLPDREAYQALVNDLVQLKTDLAAAGVTTSGQSLDVHPGFVLADFDLTGRLRAILKKHTAGVRLNVVSGMGIPVAFEPWGFFSVRIKRDGADVVLESRPVKGNFGASAPTSQVMNFLTGGDVDPRPVPDPAAQGLAFGLSTSLLFADEVDREALVLPGAPAEHPLAGARVRDVPDLIANSSLPFFHTGTTDCASCHSETTLRLTHLLPVSPFAYKQPEGISGVSSRVLHKDQWNVRDFGWGFNFRQNVGFHATISQRAANEASDSADFTNKNYNTGSVPP